MEDEKDDEVEKIEACKLMKMVVKELETKEELYNIEVITTQALEVIVDKLVLD